MPHYHKNWGDFLNLLELRQELYMYGAIHLQQWEFQTFYPIDRQHKKSRGNRRKIN